MAKVEIDRRAKRGAWTGAMVPGSYPRSDGGIGVEVVLTQDVDAAVLLLPPGSPDRPPVPTVAKLRSEFPAARCATVSGATTIVWSGPGQWTLFRARTGLPETPRTAPQRPSTVVELAGGKAVLTISGPDAVSTLAKGCPLDLHPKSFAPSAAASTMIEHIQVQIWRAGGGMNFGLAVPRSQAADFAYWLVASAAEFGYRISEAG